MKRRVQWAALIALLITGAAIAVVELKPSRQGPPIHWLGKSVSTDFELESATVENPTLIGSFKFGDQCNAFIGSLRVVTVDKKNLLVRFSPDDPIARDCPRGTLLFVSKDDFNSYVEEAKAEQRERQKEALAWNREQAKRRQQIAHVRSLLSGSKQ